MEGGVCVIEREGFVPQPQAERDYVNWRDVAEIQPQFWALLSWS